MQERNNNHQQQDFDQLNKALDGFDQNPLNLTNEQKDNEQQDPQIAAKIKTQYQNFMNQMKNMSAGQDQAMNNLTNMLGGLLKNLSDQLVQEGGQQDFKKSFGDFLGNLKDDKVEDAAQKLLSQFMDKQLLQEPLKQTKHNYEQFFKKQEGKIPVQDYIRFRKQYQVVEKILQALEKDPQNKTQLIALFEEMQQHGKPPQGIASTMGMYSM